MARDSKLASHGTFGDALVAEATSALSTLRGLIDHPALRNEQQTIALRGTVEQVEQRLSRGELCVVVAGEPGAGKTTFVDALIGDRRLGQALADAPLTTFIRNNGWYDYDAKFPGGRHEEFASRVPDRTDELNAAIEDLAQALATAGVELRNAQIAEAHASEQFTKADAALDQGRRSFESSLSTLAHANAELRDAETASRQAQDALGQIEQAIPRALREQPRWWALWLWLLIALFLVARRSVWKEWHDRRGQHDQAIARLPAARQDATGAAAAREQAQSELAALVTAQRAALAELETARQSSATAERERERLDRALAEQRAELERSATQRLEQFFSDLARLSESSRRGRSIIEIEIEYPARRLPEDVVLVDSPGIRSQDEHERNVAWDVIRERADGCILIAELDRAVSQSTKRFLLQMREVVPHVLLVLTKMDKAFLDAMRRGGSEPWEQVEQARRIGTRRFAREIGRNADEVLSISVAAQSALEDPKSGLARRFDLEIEKLFQLLRHERALILGTRAAGVVRRCIAETSEAEQRAEKALAERIAALEADRLPNPEDFRRAVVQEASPELDAGAARAIERGLRSIEDNFQILRAQCVQQLAGGRSRQALLERAARCEHDLSAGVQTLTNEASRALEIAMDAEVRTLEQAVFAKLRQRYQLIHDVRRSSTSEARVEQAIVLAQPEVALTVPLARTATWFSRKRIAFGALGTLVAGAIGTLIAPGLGTLAGVVLGPFLAFVVSRAALERRAIETAHGELALREQALIELMRGRTQSVREGLADALDQSLGRVIVRFGRIISEPMEAEQQQIDRERASLFELEQLRSALEAHDARLGDLTRDAQQASIGLCR